MKEGSREEYEALKEFIKSQLGSATASHRSWLIKGDVDYQKLDTSFREAQILTLRELNAGEVAATYNVPISQVFPNLISRVYDKETDYAQFKKEVIGSWQKLVAIKVNKRLIDEGFSFDDYAFRFKNDRLVNPKTRAEVHKMYNTMNVLTEEEVRKDIGYEEKKVSQLEEEIEEGRENEEEIDEEESNEEKPEEKEPKEKK